MKKFTYALLGAALMLPCVARADLTTESKEFDINEIQAKMQEISDNEFKKLDSNGDNTISKQEYIDYLVAETKKKGEESFSQLDTDKDGNISKQEYDAFISKATGQMSEFLKAMQEQQKKQEQPKAQ